MAKYSMIIGEGSGMNAADLDRLRISALLHDVGKIGVDDRVLKKPGKLTDEEFELMKQHPSKGANIMRPVAQLKDMLPGIELHHERMDGAGYPYGLHGDQIPMMARIIAVADTFDAITTNRPYQSAMDLELRDRTHPLARRHEIRCQRSRRPRSRRRRGPHPPNRHPRRSLTFRATRATHPCCHPESAVAEGIPLPPRRHVECGASLSLSAVEGPMLSSVNFAWAQPIDTRAQFVHL